MKYLFSIILAISILFSCGTDTEKNTNKATPSNKSNSTNTVASKPSKTKARPIIESDTYKGQLVTLSRIYLKYSNNGMVKTKEVQTDLAKVTHNDLTKVKAFVFELTQKSKQLLSNTFLKKPSKKDLLAIYKMRFINWNSMSLEPVTEKVLDKMEMDKINDNELLTCYYRLLSGQLATNRNKAETFTETNIDLNKLGLTSEQEKGIVFHTITNKFSRKYNMYARSQKDDCNKLKQMSRSFPKINGKHMFESNSPKFDDFNFIMGNNRPSASFSQMHGSAFEKAKAHFLKCKF